MSKTRISAMVLFGVMRKIRKSTGSNLGFFLSLCRRGATATTRSAMLVLIVALLVSPLPVSAAAPDPVLEWIGVMNTTVLKAGTAPNVTGRVVALVSASVFDAVNGIEPRFHPLHVRPDAPHNASQRAAAIQAAYVILMNLYGAQQGGTLTSQHDASLAALASTEKPESIAAGVAWGQSVADAIWTWRQTDGFAPPPPPFLGAPNVGVWRPTPTANNPGATPQIATMMPWVLTRPSQFRTGPSQVHTQPRASDFRLPPSLALNSPEYAKDLNEVKENGSLSSLGTAHGDTALFWALNTPLAWNRIAAQLSAARGLSLTENAHLFAVLNVALADAITACWDGKYRYVFWRPVTAIRAGAAPGDPDANWQPLLDHLTGTPAHPEYPSAHSTYSGAAQFILTAAFHGDENAFSLTSEITSGTRSYASFSEAIAEIADARVFGGIHLRYSCTQGNHLGQAVADYVSSHAMRARGDDRNDEED